MPPLPNLECPNCGRSFRPANLTAKYCSLRCKDSASLKRRREREREMLSTTQPRPKSQLSNKELNDWADKINADKAAALPASEILPEEVFNPPSQQQSAIDLFRKGKLTESE